MKMPMNRIDHNSNIDFRDYEKINNLSSVYICTDPKGIMVNMVNKQDTGYELKILDTN